MLEKILLADDEPAILQGYHRVLHREFQIDTAVGAAEALPKVQAQPYAVVVSDMNMPGMDGVQLLAKIKMLAPNTIRVMLTGNAELETAMNAVNEGAIFRFLTKPCGKETLAKALTAGLVQYRLVNAEKELLEQTLRGSIQVLTEVLSLVNPAAFSRAVRIRKYVNHVVEALGLSNPWRFEVAAMMSQLGCVTLHPVPSTPYMPACPFLPRNEYASTLTLKLAETFWPTFPAWNPLPG
jgi:YesN/AraC family two-component response regulator